MAVKHILIINTLDFCNVSVILLQFFRLFDSEIYCVCHQVFLKIYPMLHRIYRQLITRCPVTVRYNFHIWVLTLKQRA